MTDRRTDSNQNLPAVAAGVSGQHRERRVYRAPTLKYLGSVRELTLGTTQGRRPDGGITFRRTR
jgi:hypothetical protein